MRTNIDLNDELVEEAFKHAENIKTKRELIETALRDFIAHKRMKDLRDLKGKIEFAEDYDYKDLRKGT
jgi:Arc/MetJ family transcription regulator